jgi:hypothetical protein
MPSGTLQAPPDPWKVFTDLPRQNRLQEAIHEPSWEARARIIAALASSYEKSLRHQARTLAACSAAAKFYVTPTTHKVSPWLSRCKNRLCPFCSHHRSQLAAATVANIVRQIPRPRVLVLTLRSTNNPLTEEIARLRASFARLRRQPWWKKAVTGGVYTIEITRNPTTAQWHPHIHAILAGNFLPQPKIKAEWKRITEDSDIVHIADVTNREGVAREISKYVGKPQSLDNWPADAIRDYAAATRGARMLHTWGKFHSTPAPDADLNPAPPPERWTVSLGRLMHLTEMGFTTPAKAIALIALRWPLFARFVYLWHPQISPTVTKTDATIRLLRAIRGLGNKPPPRAAPKHTDEELDARLFAVLTQFRREEAQSLYETPPSGNPDPWQSLNQQDWSK